MPPTADQFGDYLAPGEPVVAVSTGTLSGTSFRYPVSIVLTDRRLLCLSEEGRFTTVDYDSISTIQSHPRTTRTYHVTDYRLPLGAGCLGALLGGIGVLVLAAGVLVPLLAFAAVGGVVAAEYLRRNADELGWKAVTEVTASVPSDVDGTTVRRWFQRFVPDAVDGFWVLMGGSVVVAAGSFVGLVLLAPGGLVVLSVLVLVGGIALVDYGRRHEDDLDGVGLVRHHELDVHIRTDGDRTIHIRSDPSEAFVQELSRVVFVDDGEQHSRVSHIRSSSP